MIRLRSKTAGFAAAATLGFYALLGAAWSHEAATSPPGRSVVRRAVSIPIRDFSLTDQAGRPFRFQRIKGKVILAAFAYTTCPDLCPLITAAMRSAQERLTQAERGSVHLITITTDPEIDSPAVLAAYARRYRADFSNWAFLTGDPKTLKSVWINFGVKVQRKARGLIDHTSLTAVIDSKGSMRFAYYGAAPDSERVLQDIRRLLKGP